MKNYILVCLSSALMAVCGCDKGESPVVPVKFSDMQVGELRFEPFEMGKKCLVKEMSPEDVVLAVNGYPLTKQALEDFMVMRVNMLMARGKKNLMAVSKEVDEFRERYPKFFIAQRLLIDEAFRQGVVTTNDVETAVAKAVVKTAEAEKTSVDQLMKRYKGKERYFYYELASSYIMDTFIRQKIPPAVDVNEDFVTNVIAQIAADNVKAKATNALYRVEMENIRKRIVSGELSFEKAANEYSTLEKDDADMKLVKDGDWGDFEEGSLAQGGIGAAAFSIGKGEITGVLESDNGFHIVKVVDVSPAKTNEEGMVVVKERRHLAHVYKSKIALYENYSKIVLNNELKSQIQFQAIDKYVYNMTTNGLNRIEYPHGRILFK